MNLFECIEQLDSEKQLLIALSILAHVTSENSAGAIYSHKIEGKDYSMILLIDQPQLAKDFDRAIAENPKFAFKKPDVFSQN
jgi:hypothetical protein